MFLEQDERKAGLQINGEPLAIEKRIHQKNQNDEIILTIYHYPRDGGGGLFFYSVQIHLGRLIRSVFPRDMSDSFSTMWDAKIAANRCLRQLAKNSPAAKKRLEKFDLLQIYQREFDF